MKKIKSRRIAPWTVARLIKLTKVKKDEKKKNRDLEQLPGQ